MIYNKISLFLALNLFKYKMVHDSSILLTSGIADLKEKGRDEAILSASVVVVVVLK